MLGFAVTTPRFDKVEIEGTRYSVNDDGALVTYLDDHETARWLHDEWVDIQELGVRLSDAWPPDKLEFVLQEIKTILAVTYGHYVHLVGPTEKYAPGFFNEVDSLTAAILASVGISAGLGNSKHPEVDAVREHLAHTFGVHVPSTRIRPSGYMSRLHCPRCGDRLFVDPDPKWTLQCRRGPMGLSDKATEWLTDLCEAAPPIVANRDTAVAWGGRWHCPCDGTLMDASPTELPQCPTCHRVLGRHLIYHLIEMHSHS